MKYIVIGAKVSDQTRVEIPIVFPNIMVHADMADRVKNILVCEHNFQEVEVMSAGDVSFSLGQPVCSGKSETLDVSSRPGDSDLLRMYDYTGGLVSC